MEELFTDGNFWMKSGGDSQQPTIPNLRALVAFSVSHRRKVVMLESWD
jgi:hypothetical protein